MSLSNLVSIIDFISFRQELSVNFKLNCILYYTNGIQRNTLHLTQFDPFATFHLLCFCNCYRGVSWMDCSEALRYRFIIFIRLQEVSLSETPLHMVHTRPQHPVLHQDCDVCLNHQAVNDPHLGQSRKLVQITHCSIIATVDICLVYWIVAF